MALRITGLGEEIASVTSLPWHLPLEEWPETLSLPKSAVFRGTLCDWFEQVVTQMLKFMQ